MPSDKASPEPYSKEHRDPYDHAVDTSPSSLNPQPIRNGEGATIVGPRNPSREKQNPDTIRPPTTDSGHIPNMKWSFADSHVRIEEGGWARETTVRELPTSVELAGVNMRLEQGAIRELHWHKQAEWAYVLSGVTRITCMDGEGANYAADVGEGGLWYFPAGIPHSLQAMSSGGTEFLLIFNDGNFSEDETFLLSDWLAHSPKSVTAQNFHTHPDNLAHLPGHEKYIFQGSNPTKGAVEDQPAREGIRTSRHRFTHDMKNQKPIKASGGEVRIADSSNFPISTAVSAAHVLIQPGGLREMHWHPSADEWSYFIRGRARITIFAASGTSRTFNYQAGDVGIVPKGMAHYVQNISPDEPVEMLEMFRSARFEDFSLEQWLAETPKQLVKESLFTGEEELGRKFVDQLSAVKDPVKKSSSKL